MLIYFSGGVGTTDSHESEIGRKRKNTGAKKDGKRIKKIAKSESIILKYILKKF